ncbi:MAG: penicillin-binding protein 2 [Chloroflexota bacterium]|nr:penicillin-binding protein 2 [Chloroflexota bacterium]
MSGQTLSRAPTRLRAALLVILAVGLVLAARLFYWQIIRWDDLRQRAAKETHLNTIIDARRGAILTSDGLVLAEDIFVYTISVNPKQIDKLDDLARQLAPILGRSSDSLLTRFRTEPAPITLAKDAPATVGEAVEDLQNQDGMAGLAVTSRRVRVYPGGSFAAHLVGFVNTQRAAANGVEQFKDGDLAGVAGNLSGASDALHEVIPFDPPTNTPPIDGADVVLTIDSAMQRIVEAELANAIRDSGAPSGLIIVLDPKTGAILALAVYPAADLNAYFEPANQPKYTDTAVSAQYEPGSVFKIITIAAALDAGTVTPGTFFDDAGSIYVGGRTIKNHNDIAPGRVSLTDVLRLSLNVEATKMSVGLGAERFYQYVRSFGFGTPTRVELAGEVAGLVKSVGDGRWRDADLATNSFGQGISVTPLQMITAVAAVANQGKLVRPYIVQELRTSNGKVLKTNPEVVRQVIRPETAQTLTRLLADAIVGESSNKAVVPGYRIAGKTGTASIPIPGGYDPVKTIASFVGYLPADDPRFVILVKLDKPQSSEWGSQVASPVFAAVAKQLVLLAGLPPDAVRLSGK